MSDAEGLRVAITIDAEHPDGSRCAPGNCLSILGTLDQAGVRATFFLQGRWVTAYPDLAREVARRGHLIGNHSHYHARMPLLTDAGQVADVKAAEEAITSVVGVDPRPWFRSPFGAGLQDPELDGNLARLGYRNVPWDADGQDWKAERTALQVEESLVEETLAGEGARIALLHSWPDQTAAALPGILARLEQAGAEFVTVGQVLPGV
jgi:peptidoglycan/xylan/chitin deacetylase (PgdA/CDA1 family)